MSCRRVEPHISDLGKDAAAVAARVAYTVSHSSTTCARARTLIERARQLAAHAAQLQESRGDALGSASLRSPSGE